MEDVWIRSYLVSWYLTHKFCEKILLTMSEQEIYKLILVSENDNNGYSCHEVNERKLYSVCIDINKF